MEAGVFQVIFFGKHITNSNFSFDKTNECIFIHCSKWNTIDLLVIANIAISHYPPTNKPLLKQLYFFSVGDKTFMISLLPIAQGEQALRACRARDHSRQFNLAVRDL
ncbi:hypothetical protein DN752_23395 [Echinicola strongylocentroti]|uniref:Uncharacterized protein n=1 Tax=Echinicola strongylocentroti TaxID=1795355 RepID=A0A2Z4IPT9_9BACT|nr:hypothetical protein DN752_23395 [Echinicola strongylocentroti]